MKPTKTCIVVADGAHARIYINDGPGKGIAELPQYAQTVDLKPSREIKSDSPGRAFDSAGQGRHAMEPQTDPKRHSKQEFHRELARQIEADLVAGKFDRLVLVSPPATLGDLRQSFSKNAAAKIHGELAKDLVKASDKELLTQLGNVLAI